MNHRLHTPSTEILENRYGLRVAARLSAGAQDLPHDLSERLRVARQQALARRKLPSAAGVVPTRAISLGDDRLGFWGRLASMAMVVALAVGLVTIHTVYDDGRTVEVADLDAALLTDDLPPEAYADPGFMQYLRVSQGGSLADR